MTGATRRGDGDVALIDTDKAVGPAGRELGRRSPAGHRGAAADQGIAEGGSAADG
jgi:hypothetical protein